MLTEEVSGSLTASYQSSPWDQRLSQLKTAGGTEELGVYGYNTRGDVESVSTAAGDTSATYGCTARGQDDAAEFTGRDKADPADPAKDAFNPYRFNAKRWHVSSETYDMGFRDYNPGLNRASGRTSWAASSTRRWAAELRVSRSCATPRGTAPPSCCASTSTPECSGVTQRR